MTLDRKYLLWALVYALVGMCLGIIMAATQDHTQHVTHAHQLMVGFVASLIYGVVHKLWLEDAVTRLAKLQFLAHQAGACLMCLGLFLLYGGILPASQLEPILGVASLSVLLGALLMLVLVVKTSAMPRRLVR